MRVPADLQRCVISDGGIEKVGATALSALAFCELAGGIIDSKYFSIAVTLGRRLLALQGSSGLFFPHKQRYSSGEIIPFSSAYYDSEASLALLKLYRFSNDAVWLDAAKLSIEALVDYQSKLPAQNQPHDHWLLYALREMDEALPSDRWKDHSRKIAQSIVSYQNTGHCDTSVIGSYGPEPRSTTTAVRTEGLCAAYSLLRKVESAPVLKSIIDAIVLGLGYQHRTYISAQTSLVTHDPLRSHGGFRRDLDCWLIQIDCVQHNMLSILGALAVLTDDNVPQDS